MGTTNSEIERVPPNFKRFLEFVRVGQLKFMFLAQILLVKLLPNY